jgi:thymidylate synthase (FAD)
MNVTKPYAKMMPPAGSENQDFTKENGIDLLKRVEWCARISHRSEDSVTDDSYDRFIRTVVLNHGDWSVTEHVVVSVDMVVDRGITHEIVRHRVGAYTQESTRFVNYEKKMAPSFIDPIYGDKTGPRFDQLDVWTEAIEQAEGYYKKLINLGCAPQIARSVFPNALASRIVVTYNLRNWRYFLLARTTKNAHPQMRDVTIRLLQEFQEKIPILFEDIIPNEDQKSAFSKPR